MRRTCGFKMNGAKIVWAWGEEIIIIINWSTGLKSRLLEERGRGGMVWEGEGRGGEGGRGGREGEGR